MAETIGTISKKRFPEKCLRGWTIAKYLSIVTDMVTNTEPTRPIWPTPKPIGNM